MTSLEFRRAARVLTQRCGLSRPLVWIAQNPLKISGIAGGLGEALSAVAGSETVGDVCMAIGGGIGVSAFICQTIWGKGGEPSPADAASGEDARPATAQQFRLSKCFRPWRFPVESTACQNLLASSFFAAAGVEMGLKAGYVNAMAASLVVTGVLAAIGSVYANAVGDRPGQRFSPMQKSAIFYGASTAVYAVTAATAPSAAGHIILGFATGAYAVNNIFWGVSRRHENRKPSPAGHLHL